MSPQLESTFQRKVAEIAKGPQSRISGSEFYFKNVGEFGDFDFFLLKKQKSD